ncbi:hypothetical protein NC653_013343 [Populus alba x Populus x berolinensis]|uniref:Uncharacterized protein n=1 Tax=Populus alba x Populus x berolinensis TaxID=444605 RepID=A0AAD6QUA8_9ROSI|nr:hypothetical protein NC653_013343 [Populus alba x Populus x berolinensis]
MGPLTLAVDTKTSSNPHLDAPILKLQKTKPFASINAQEDSPFDFLRILFEGVIAGGTAGVVVETALYPIDTIKTRLQAGFSWAARGGGKIMLKGLYSGLAGNLAGVLPASALFVGVYEPTKQKLLKTFPENLSAVAHLTAGAVGGIAASLIRVPTEVVKQRMQTGQFTSAPDAVRLIVSKEGFKGFYAGYGSFLLRDLPFDAIQFCIYEQLRIGYRVAAQRELNDPENAAIGAFAGNIEVQICELPSFPPYDTHFLIEFGCICHIAPDWHELEWKTACEHSALTGAITTPLDVIKTRLMVQGSANQYKGIVDCVSTVVREEGPTALLKGIGPRVLWIGIGGSIFFGVLERTKRLLAQRRPISDQQPNPKQD